MACNISRTNTIVAMRLLPPVFLAIILWFEISCHLQKENRSNQDSVVHIKYSFKVEFVSQADATIMPLADSTYISYKGSKLVMRLPIPTFDLIRTGETDSGTVFSEKATPTVTNIDYVLIALPDSGAVYYKSDSLAKIGIKINGDSMFRKRIPIVPNIIDPKVDSLVNVWEANGIQEEVYIVKNKPDDSYPDSVILHFSKHLNHVPFTFSSVLDKSRGMKLYRFRFVTNATFSSTINKRIPQRELVCEIQLINPPTDKFLNDLLK